MILYRAIYPTKKGKLLLMLRSHFEERFHYYNATQNASPNAKDFQSYFFNKEKENKRETKNQITQ